MSDRKPSYYLSWTSVDGAGSDFDQQTDDKQVVIDEANAAQADAEADGNGWGYAYKVNRIYSGGGFPTRSDVIYNARTKERY